MPTLFNFNVDELVSELNQGEQRICMAFADDLVVVCNGRDLLDAALDELEAWCADNEIALNKGKCGILVVRADRRRHTRQSEVFRYCHRTLTSESELTTAFVLTWN